MYFQQIYDETLAHYSYLVGCQKAGVAAIIDPKRDIDTYLKIAKKQNLKITHIFETHIHADFLSGSRELASASGPKMYLSDEGGTFWQYEFSHVGLHNGDTVKVGNLIFEVLHTPGHTPESISFLLTDVPASDQPVMIFTGDFVFVGDIGRPDLLEKAAGMKGTQEIGAHDLYQSLRIFSSLPDFVQVWPAHGAGSACGKALGAVPVSTVGYEKIRNWALRSDHDEASFTNELLDGQPEAPKYFAMMKKLNRVDRPLLTHVPKLTELDMPRLKSALFNNIPLIDTRTWTEFAQGFIPGSINIQNINSLSTWAGWLLKYTDPFMLVADKTSHDEIVRKLMRIGLDNILGYIPSVDMWEQAGEKLEKTHLISLDEFDQLYAENGIQLIDLRGENEYKTGHIRGAQNVFIGTLPDNMDRISRDRKVVIHCQGGDRSTIAYSLLAREGFSNILNYPGGMNQWLERKRTVVPGNFPS